MANTKKKVNKTAPVSKVEVIKKALDNVAEVKEEAQARFDSAVTSFKIVRH